jgi:hypothetical protein
VTKPQPISCLYMATIWLRRHRVPEPKPGPNAKSPTLWQGPRHREAAGTPRKEAIAAVAAESGLPRRDVYNAVVAARRP